jgi:hypothetical protein
MRLGRALNHVMAYLGRQSRSSCTLRLGTSLQDVRPFAERERARDLLIRRENSLPCIVHYIVLYLLPLDNCDELGLNFKLLCHFMTRSTLVDCRTNSRTGAVAAKAQLCRRPDADQHPDKSGVIFLLYPSSTVRNRLSAPVWRTCPLVIRVADTLGVIHGLYLLAVDHA